MEFVMGLLLCNLDACMCKVVRDEVAPADLCDQIQNGVPRLSGCIGRALTTLFMGSEEQTGDCVANLV